MKIKEADILIVPGYTNSGEDHWQTRWENKFSTARRVNQTDWHKPVVEEWTENMVSAVDSADKPVVVLAHSLGCQTFVQALQKMSSESRRKISGAFIVAPPDVENPSIRPKHLMTFGPYPRDPLPCPSILIASRNDQFCSYDIAGDMANAWGSRLIDAGESGHLNGDSGHGPWPEGLMVFAEFMAGLKPN